MRISDEEINKCRMTISSLNKNAEKVFALCETYKKTYRVNADYDIFARGTKIGTNYTLKTEDYLYHIERTMQDIVSLSGKANSALDFEEKSNKEERMREEARRRALEEKKKQEEKEKENKE